MERRAGMNHNLKPSPDVRFPTAEQRVDRALGRIGDIKGQVDLRSCSLSPTEAQTSLELAAKAHVSLAMRYYAEAPSIQDEGQFLSWLELCGLHAITAQAYRAKARELAA